MRYALLLCGTLALWAGRARADGPSFDCGKATAPIEQLICDDPELIRLDGLLGQAYASKLAGSAAKEKVKTEQRAWLASRFERCPVPKIGRALTPAQAWEAAPCLAALYSERVTALGGGAALHAERVTLGGDPYLAPSDPHVTAPGFVHPICLEVALGSDMLENAPPPGVVPLASCNRGNRHRPVAVTKTGYLTTPDARGGYEGSFSYHVIGALADGRRVAITAYWGGGSGVFDNVVVLSEPEPGELAAKVVAPGGDRCFGGIDDAKVVGPDTIEVASNVTGSDLLALGGTKAPEHLARDLAGCAICCLATVSERYDLAKDTTTTVSITITSLPGDENEGRKCASALIERVAPTLPATIDADATRRLAADIIAKCGKNE